METMRTCALTENFKLRCQRPCKEGKVINNFWNCSFKDENSYFSPSSKNIAPVPFQKFRYRSPANRHRQQSPPPPPPPLTKSEQKIYQPLGPEVTDLIIVRKHHCQYLKRQILLHLQQHVSRTYKTVKTHLNGFSRRDNHDFVQKQSHNSHHERHEVIETLSQVSFYRKTEPSSPFQQDQEGSSVSKIQKSSKSQENLESLETHKCPKSSSVHTCSSSQSDKRSSSPPPHKTCPSPPPLKRNKCKAGKESTRTQGSVQEERSIFYILKSPNPLTRKCLKAYLLQNTKCKGLQKPLDLIQGNTTCVKAENSVTSLKCLSPTQSNVPRKCSNSPQAKRSKCKSRKDYQKLRFIQQGPHQQEENSTDLEFRPQKNLLDHFQVKSESQETEGRPHFHIRACRPLQIQKRGFHIHRPRHCLPNLQSCQALQGLQNCQDPHKLQNFQDPHRLLNFQDPHNLQNFQAQHSPQNHQGQLHSQGHHNPQNSQPPKNHIRQILPIRARPILLQRLNFPRYLFFVLHFIALIKLYMRICVGRVRLRRPCHCRELRRIRLILLLLWFRFIRCSAAHQESPEAVTEKSQTEIILTDPEVPSKKPEEIPSEKKILTKSAPSTGKTTKVTFEPDPVKIQSPPLVDKDAPEICQYCARYIVDKACSEIRFELNLPEAPVRETTPKILTPASSVEEEFHIEQVVMEEPTDDPEEIRIDIDFQELADDTISHILLQLEFPEDMEITKDEEGIKLVEESRAVDEVIESKIEEAPPVEETFTEENIETQEPEETVQEIEKEAEVKIEDDVPDIPEEPIKTPEESPEIEPEPIEETIQEQETIQETPPEIIEETPQEIYQEPSPTLKFPIEDKLEKISFYSVKHIYKLPMEQIPVMVEEYDTDEEIQEGITSSESVKVMELICSLHKCSLESLQTPQLEPTGSRDQEIQTTDFQKIERAIAERDSQVWHKILFEELGRMENVTIERSYEEVEYTKTVTFTMETNIVQTITEEVTEVEETEETPKEDEKSNQDEGELKGDEEDITNKEEQSLIEESYGEIEIVIEHGSPSIQKNKNIQTQTQTSATVEETYEAEIQSNQINGEEKNQTQTTATSALLEENYQLEILNTPSSFHTETVTSLPLKIIPSCLCETTRDCPTVCHAQCGTMDINTYYTSNRLIQMVISQCFHLLQVLLRHVSPVNIRTNTRGMLAIFRQISQTVTSIHRYTIKIRRNIFVWIKCSRVEEEELLREIDCLEQGNKMLVDCFIKLLQWYLKQLRQVTPCLSPRNRRNPDFYTI